MHKIISKKELANNTYEFVVEARDIAKAAKPGQFIILRLDEKGERVPFTIADYDKDKGTITLVILVVGKTTQDMAKLDKDDTILDIAGPLGNASETGKFGHVCLIGGGLGIAPIFPIARKLKQDNKITCIIGAKSKDYLFWQDKFKKISDNLIICTDDGSDGEKGFVTEALKKLIEKEKIDRAIAIGPPIMMKNVADVTKDKVKTIASLNTLMVDGIGMCGCCRVEIKHKIKFACCDGPEFDAHDVNWDDLLRRNCSYQKEEGECRCRNGS